MEVVFIADVSLFLLENWVMLYVRLRIFLPQRFQLEANSKS